MDYLKIYNSLIYKRQNIELLDKTQCYCEKHHILPKSLGGSNDSKNLVNLTLREHYIAHLLLFKIYKNTEFKEKVLSTIYYMSNYKKYKKYNSRLYKINKIKYLNSKIIKNNGYKGSKIFLVWFEF